MKVVGAILTFALLGGVGWLYWTNRIRIWLAILLVFVVAIGSMSTQSAFASVRQSLTYGCGGLCEKWHIQEYRDGQLLHAQLWHMNLTVSWRYRLGLDGHYHFADVRKTRGRYVGPTWQWGGWYYWKETHKHHPNRLIFQLKAQFDGNGAYLYTEHNYPRIRMTIEPRRPLAFYATCGCTL